MPKPWEKYKSQGGPWDKYKTEEEGTSEIGTAIEQAGQAVSLGYLPQITAAIESPFDEESRAYLNAPIKDIFDPEFREKAAKGRGIDKTYQQIRDEKIAQYEKGKEVNPISGGVGTGLGIVGSVASVPAKLFGGAATLGQAAMSGLKGGAVYGALSNPGDVAGEVSPLQLGERGFNATTGALGGALGGAAGFGIGKAIEKIPAKLNEFAGERAYKALGRGTKKEAEALGKEGIQKIGQTALKENVIGVIPKSKQALAESVDDGIKKVGEALGDNVDKLDNFEQELMSKGERIGLSKINLAEELEQRLTDKSIGGSEAVNNAVSKRLDFILGSEGGESFGIKEAQKLKEKLGNKVPWSKLKISGRADLTPEQLVDLEMYNMLSERTLSYADALADRIGGDTSSRVKELRDMYSQFMRMKKLTDSEAARELTNRIVSPSDLAIGAIGGIASAGDSGDPLKSLGTAALLSGGHKFAREYGSQVAARGASALANKMAPVIGGFTKNLPKAGFQLGQLTDLMTQWEKTKNKPVSQDQAAQMYLNQGNGK